MAQAATAPTRFDPANDTHFGVSEWDEFKLRQAALAMETVGDMLDGIDFEDRVEISSGAIAAVFRSFSYGISGLLDSGAFVFPRRRGQQRRSG